MKSPGNRSFSFLSGIFIGMLATIGLVFLVMNGFNPFRVFSGRYAPADRDTIVDHTRPPKIARSTPKEQETVPVAAEKSSVRDTMSPEVKDSTLPFPPPVRELPGDIIVKRDELLEIRYIDLVQLDKPDAARVKTDSLLKSFQGSPGSTAQQPFRIEYWRSPVNYRGFKLIRNALVVFGLDPSEPARIYSLDSKLYLRQGSHVYRLFTTDEFEPFARVADEHLLKQLR